MVVFSAARASVGRSQLRSSSGGFTLVELVIVVAIAALLLAFAVPSFMVMGDRNELRSSAQGFANSVQQARELAVTRGGSVTLTQNDRGFSCSLTVSGVSTTCSGYATLNPQVVIGGTGSDTTLGIGVTSATNTITIAPSGRVNTPIRLNFTHNALRAESFDLILLSSGRVSVRANNS